MEKTADDITQNEGDFLYIRKLSPYYDRENSKISFRQIDAGFARHDSRYHKLSLYINGITSQVMNKDGICEWRFSIPLYDLELESDKFFRIRSLRKYYKRADKKYGYFSNDAGFAVVNACNDKKYMNLFVNMLPSQTPNKDGILQYRFEILLTDRKSHEQGEADKPATEHFPRPNTAMALDGNLADDVPF